MRRIVEPIDLFEFALTVPPRDSSGAEALFFFCGVVWYG